MNYLSSKFTINFHHIVILYINSERISKLLVLHQNILRVRMLKIFFFVTITIFMNSKMLDRFYFNFKILFICIIIYSSINALNRKSSLIHIIKSTTNSTIF